MEVPGRSPEAHTGAQQHSLGGVSREELESGETHEHDTIWGPQVERIELREERGDLGGNEPHAAIALIVPISDQLLDALASRIASHLVAEQERVASRPDQASTVDR
jgi:hypothetical protein